MIKKKKWVLAPKYSDDIIEQILRVRDIDDPERFLNPDFDHRYDPYLLPNFGPALDLIKGAVEKDRPIGIYGDYDCDGIPGTALLYLALKKIGARVVVYIPRRETGYGLSKEGIDVLAKDGVKLLITVDNGTTAIDEVAYALSKGLQVIITDHHQPHTQIPPTTLINPKLEDSEYPFSELCGTGVVFKLLEGLATLYPEKITAAWLKWQLDLVALATICDMVDLVGENRVLAKFGLKVLRQTRNIGLKALIKITGADPEVLSAGTVGFGLGPRLNAVGRMEGDPMMGFRLLTSDDQREADQIARQLDSLNKERQDMVMAAVDQAEKLLMESGQDKTPAIALEHLDWTPGIVGLIASKLLERYHKPVFAFDAKTGKGSARSIDDYPLPPSLEILKDHFLSYGGHNLAAGMTLKEKSFSNFQKALHSHSAKTLGSEERLPHLHIDAEILLGDVSVENGKKISNLEPFGVGNPRPLFLLKNIPLQDVKVIGNGGKHLRGYMIAENKQRTPFVAFSMVDRKADFSERSPVNLVGRLELNTWNNHTSAELHVVDVG